MFVVASAEAPPAELHATADELVIQFPWGSLLQAVLTAGDALGQVTQLLAPGGCLAVSLSVAPRDRVAGLDNLDDESAGKLAKDIATATGTVNTGVAPLSWGEVQASGSSWAKRLGVGRSRRGYRLTFRRTADSWPRISGTADAS